MEKSIFWGVDLVGQHLLSGLQSQGPPTTLHGVDYMGYIGFSVQVSSDGRTWEDCCSQDGSTTNFYADDKKDEVNQQHCQPIFYDIF